MIRASGHAAQDAATPLAPFSFERREPRERDAQIDILCCGVCHSDRSKWGGALYPSLPGHEIVGRVTRVGSSVQKLKTGDLVGVGCMVDSCRTCTSWREGLEQYCEVGFTGTYNGPGQGTGATTYGGYSDVIVVDESFVLRIPDNLDLAAATAASLLCAGITTYSPLRRWRVQPGQKVGIVGLGGLGHTAAELARAMGAHVAFFTTSPNKREDALALGAHEVVVSRDKEAMAAQGNSFDFILDTVAAPHDLDSHLVLLARDGAMVLVGAPAEPHPATTMINLIMKRRQLSGSPIGSIAETQETLEFCAQHSITSEIEMIPIQSINEAYERMLKSDVEYRFVIDMASLKEAA